ncbi:hypothetical protein J4439_05725 [Candidatus Woesearchaeota archaeon]|nr:hypothetical protein [Candidatus Woesearchaeota archaeon]
MDCLSLKCQAVLGSWHPRIAVPGVEGLTDYNLRRLALTTGDVLKGFTSTFTLYGYSHTATLLEAFPSELPRRAVLLIDGVKTREFRLTDDEKSMSTGRLLNNYYAFDDGTFLYVKEVSPGHGSGRPSASVRFAKPFVDGEHYLWATYNTSFGICVTHGECPSNRRCVDGICIAYCGNLVCEAGEDCPEDCASCGDARCSGGETCTTCARDCGPCQTCGDNVCSEVEGCGICPTDCGCPSLRRCEENSCVTFCGNQECEDGEECLDDCGRTMFRGKTLEVQGGGFMVEGASARVEGTLKLVNEELLFEGSRIEVTPDAIGSYLQAVTEEVTLRSGEGGPFYAVRATRRGRLLAIIPVTMVFEAHVSAEDGDILAMELPWWHVLVS